MAVEVNLDDVRDYLLESHAIEEAEGILLQNILTKQSEDAQRKKILSELQKGQPKAAASPRRPLQEVDIDVEQGLDSYKISDLLGTFEEEYERHEKFQRKRELADLEAKQPKKLDADEKIEHLKIVGDITEREIAELEKKKDWMQLKRLANQYELDKLNILHNKDSSINGIAGGSTSTTNKSNAKFAPVPFPGNSKQTMDKLYEMTEDHARKVAQNRAEALAYQRELDLMNNGKWSMNASYLRNENGLQPPGLAASDSAKKSATSEWDHGEISATVAATASVSNPRNHSIAAAAAVGGRGGGGGGGGENTVVPGVSSSVPPFASVLERQQSISFALAPKEVSSRNPSLQVVDPDRLDYTTQPAPPQQLQQQQPEQQSSQDRLRALLSSVATVDGLQTQQREIDALRQQSTLHKAPKSAVQSDAVVADITRQIQSTRQANQIQVESGARSDDSNDDNKNHTVSRHMSVPDYLEQWLQNPSASSSSSQQPQQQLQQQQQQQQQQAGRTNVDANDDNSNNNSINSRLGQLVNKPGTKSKLLMFSGLQGILRDQQQQQQQQQQPQPPMEMNGDTNFTTQISGSGSGSAPSKQANVGAATNTANTTNTATTTAVSASATASSMNVEALIRQLQEDNERLQREKAQLLQNDRHGRTNQSSSSNNYSANYDQEQLPAVSPNRRPLQPQQPSYQQQQQQQQQPYPYYSGVQAFRSAAAAAAVPMHTTQQQQPPPPYGGVFPNMSIPPATSSMGYPYQLGNPAPFNYPQQQQLQMPMQPYHQQQHQVPADPQSQSLTMQMQLMQQMADKMEQDNQKLLSAMGLGANLSSADNNGSNNSNSNYSDMGNINNNNNNNGSSNSNNNMGVGMLQQPFPSSSGAGAGAADAGGNIGRGIDNAHLYTLERDKFRGSGDGGAATGTRPSRQELRHREEMRRIQFEIERIQTQRQLDEIRTEYDQIRTKKQKELEHEQWMQQQKQELQAVKLQQVLAKEQRMLKLQQQEYGEGGGAASALQQPHHPSRQVSRAASRLLPASGQSLLNMANEKLREESGVGRAPMPLDLSTGVVVLVDGIMVPKAMQTGNFFRVALGIFDQNGKSLVRLTASEWQHWNASASATSATSGRDQRPQQQTQSSCLHRLNTQVIRTIRFNDTTTDLTNARCLLEVQAKESMQGELKWIGWGAVPIVTAAAGVQVDMGADTNTNTNTNTTVGRFLCNNAWRAVMRKSLSDPACKDLLAQPESVVPDSWILLRVVEATQKQQASAWSLANHTGGGAGGAAGGAGGGTSANTRESGPLSTDKQLLEFYTDPMEATQTAADVESESERLLVEAQQSVDSLLKDDQQQQQQQRPQLGSRRLSRQRSAAGAAAGGMLMSPIPESGTLPSGELPSSRGHPTALTGALKAASLLRSLSHNSSTSNDQQQQQQQGGPLTIDPLSEPAAAASAGGTSSNLPPGSTRSIRSQKSAVGGAGAGSSSRAVTPQSSATAGFQALSRKSSTNSQTAAALVGNDTNSNISSSNLLSAASSPSPRPAIRPTEADKAFWYPGEPLAPCVDKYVKGDGVDIYIDTAQFLPDNCTVTRCVMRIFTSDKEQVGSVHEAYSLANSPCTSPIFKFKAELRVNNFNVTSTALVRIDTIDAVSLLPSSVGYVCFKLFATRERTQPKAKNESNAYINTGHFQLPIMAGRLTPALSVFDDQMLATLTRVPCSSLLVRILPAPKSSDGISTLSRVEFPPSDWARLGLDVTAPTYASGAYYGAACEPSEEELLCYKAKAANNSSADLVESAIMQALDSNPQGAGAFPPKPTSGDTMTVDSSNNNNNDALAQWMAKLMPGHDQMRRSIEYAFAVPHDVTAGVHVQVEQLYNVSDGGGGGIASLFSSTGVMYKVIASMAPPGLYYKDPPLYDGVYYTKNQKLDAHVKAPFFEDGFFEFVPANLTQNLYLLLDVRMVNIEAAKDDDKITVQPPGPKTSYWTLLPLGMEKIPGQGFKYAQSGVFHLPLIEGALPAEDIFKSDAPYSELTSRLAVTGKDAKEKHPSGYALKLADGAMLQVKVMNPLLKDLILPEINAPKPNVQTLFMEKLVKAAAAGTSGSNARSEKYVLDANRYPIGGGTNEKTLLAQLPKKYSAGGGNTAAASGITEELDALLKRINKEFETATGLLPDR